MVDDPKKIIAESKQVHRDTLESYKDLGVDKVNISAVGDQCTCESCAALEAGGPERIF